jgi:hypothetical protein
MKKFLVLYRMDMAAMKKMMETTSAEDRKKSMAEWGTWMKAHMANFADGGAPVGKNWQVTSSGTSQMSNDIGGYSIVQAERADEAAKILASSPHFKMPGSTCDMMEIMPMEM